jgi:hypothetical protein
MMMAAKVSADELVCDVVIYAPSKRRRDGLSRFNRAMNRFLREKKILPDDWKIVFEPNPKPVFFLDEWATIPEGTLDKKNIKAEMDKHIRDVYLTRPGSNDFWGYWLNYEAQQTFIRMR